MLGWRILSLERLFVTIGLFSPLILFSFLNLDICAEFLKIQLCPPVCICFGFNPYFFYFYFFRFDVSLCLFCFLISSLVI